MSASRIVVLTTRSQIRGVAKSWQDQYPIVHEHHEGIRECLDALDGETATAADVAAIIGNDSWTALACDVCGDDVAALVRLGDEPDYDSRTLSVCDGCLASASARLAAATGNFVASEEVQS